MLVRRHFRVSGDQEQTSSACASFHDYVAHSERELWETLRGPNEKKGNSVVRHTEAN
jgi:hypothetical protein